jgi:hypothetical protein
MLENPEDAYEVLDEEYRQKRFGSLEEYKRHIQNNLEELKSRNIFSYAVSYGSGYTQYICKDQYEDIYIFTATAVFRYTAILDTYTLELPEFASQYNSTNAQGRVALNIQKFTDSLNAGDYRYAYSKLAEGFRNNNFQNLQSFETYMRRAIHRRNIIEYGNFEQTAGLYTYTIHFINREDQDDRVIEKTIIMELREGLDFALSFNLN